MKEILGIYMDKIYNPLLKRQEVFFDRDYRSLIDLHSYGHDIESSWLLDWGCGLLGDQELAGKISEINSELARNVYRRAFRNDSLLSECERGVDKTNRIWWVQCEAVLGFVHQWEKCPEETCFRNGAAELIRYILTVMIDPRPGSEWFSEVNENGVPDRNKPILEEWKCPYHNGRMCLELISKNPDIEV